MTTAASHHELVTRGDFDNFLSALLALDRAVVEFYMQIYGTAPDQQLAMRRQNRALHAVIRKRVPDSFFGSAVAAKRIAKRNVLLNE